MTQPEILIGRWTAKTVARKRLEHPDAYVISVSSRVIAHGGMVVGFSPASFRLFVALICSPGHFVDYRDLIEFIWGDDCSGGPDAAKNVINKTLGIHRQNAALLGLQSNVFFGVGVRACRLAEPVRRVA